MVHSRVQTTTIGHERYELCIYSMSATEYLCSDIQSSATNARDEAMVLVYGLMITNSSPSSRWTEQYGSRSTFSHDPSNLISLRLERRTIMYCSWATMGNRADPESDTRPSWSLRAVTALKRSTLKLTGEVVRSGCPITTSGHPGSSG